MKKMKRIVKLHGFNWLPKIKIVIPANTESFPGGNVQESISQNGYWAAEESYVLFKILNNTSEPKTMLDIGSNTGYFSLLALKLGHNIIAIEANKIHYDYFLESIKVNNIDNSRYQYIEAFASDRDVVLFDGWTGVDGMSNEYRSPIKTIPVKDITNNAYFTKIDVEGAEPEVINSMLLNLNNINFPYIMFELTYIVNDVIDTPQVDMLHVLNDNGYMLYDITVSKLAFINDINKFISNKNQEYFDIYKKNNNKLKNAGTNILAIHNTIVDIPFDKVGDDFVLDVNIFNGEKISN